jgi:hypothetical protein
VVVNATPRPLYPRKKAKQKPEGKTCAKRKSTSLGLYSHSCVDHIAGLNKTPKTTTGRAYVS